VPTIHLETLIAAPIGRCFDLMRDVEAHLRSTAKTHERVVAGRTSGLFEAGDEVTWEATHLGVRQRLTIRITRCEPPVLLEDEMVHGAFHTFHHRHTFCTQPDGTLMVDDLHFTAPLGPLGVLAERLFLERYMRTLLRERAAVLKQLAETTSGADQ